MVDCCHAYMVLIVVCIRIVLWNLNLKKALVRKMLIEELGV